MYRLFIMSQFHRAILVTLVSGLLASCASMTDRGTPARRTTAPAPSTPEPVAAAPTPSAAATTDDLHGATAKPEPAAAEPPVPLDLWSHLATLYALPPTARQARIDKQLAWYRSRPRYWQHIQERARRYLPYIAAEVERRQLPGELALLPAVESTFQVFADSSGQAAGLWQFTPRTGRIFALKQNWWYDGRRDVIASTHAALDYLEKLHRQFNGDWLLALAAYNSGASRVRRAMNANARQGKKTDYWSLTLPRETRDYVPRLLAIARIAATPVEYGIDLDPMPTSAYFGEVALDSQIDLALAADMAGISATEIYRLNPGFKRWVTDPEGPYRLLLPIETIQPFRAELATLPADQRVTWARYKIRPGDNLTRIARHYRTNVSMLHEINKMRSDNIRAGKYLLVPDARKSSHPYRLAGKRGKKTAPSRPLGGNKTIHVVKAGDTLWVLARRYDVSTSQLASWNAMRTKDVLRQGQKLAIWHNTGKPGEKPRYQISYTVRSGDSLSVIARRFKVKISDVRRWNNLRGDLLKPGQELNLMVGSVDQAV